MFSSEAEFENALIAELSQRGWEGEVLKTPTEADLLANWAEILLANNKGQDRLNNVPLTDGEMQQIMEQITALRTPLKLNGFINGKTVAITRDNPADTLHLGKEVSLKIYDRHEIAAGQSRYQIVQQPQFGRGGALQHDRRGDLLLLINGMPLIHIELKKNPGTVGVAYNQIKKYSGEGIFSGLFSLIQIFVAMEPEEALYFANPGPDGPQNGQFNRDYAFNWADFNNEPINHWQALASGLLSIPMAHQLIGFYTVADEADGVLKVMRSYQYYAAHAISDTVAKTDWRNPNRLGGFIWHTTGSGKTMTSFKAAQLVANSKDADKVVFLLDRIELGAQTLQAYRDFAGDADAVQATEHTGVLLTKLKSTNPAHTLIVSSIQKMSRLADETDGLKDHDLETIRNKRVLFVVDECHRSTFGDMLIDIKKTFPGAVFFGFTGTPIHAENIRKNNTTADVFGNELHRYSIADGIRDKNVLGFDPYQIETYKQREVREAVALQQAKAATVQEALADAKKKKVFNRFMNDMPMAGSRDGTGVYQKGIEDYLDASQYNRDAHQNAVVKDIADNWVMLSQSSEFHAIFATSSIPEAISYYRLLKARCPQLSITALFDPHIDDEGNADPAYKTDGLVEILQDYNAAYGHNFDLGSHAGFKKDVANRLAHKKPYTRIAAQPEQQLDLLIVVDQMLTGFDSKWINTLYLDKLLRYEHIIQAFSRTNRLYGPDKPFGTIRYYRKPHTMTRNIEAAVRLYSGDKPIGLFADRLPRNIERMNGVSAEIVAIFEAAGIADFKQLPDDATERAAFAKQFKLFSDVLEAARIQGFSWDTREYDAGTKPPSTISIVVTHQQYLTLLQRYKELGSSGEGAGGGGIPFDLDSHITEIDTGKIDVDYMNSRFQKYLKALRDDASAQARESTLLELQKSFSSLSQEEQKLAEILLRDIQRGDVQIDANRSFRDYLTDYRVKAQDEEVAKLVEILGVDADKLTALRNTAVNEGNLNEYGRFDDLKASIDKAKAKAWFEAQEGKSIANFKVNIRAANLLRDFVLGRGGSL